MPDVSDLIVTDYSVLKSGGKGVSGQTGTSWSLVERARGGDQAAWSQLIAWINPLLLHWCRKAGMQDADTLDICQEVAHAVSRNLQTFQQTQSSFRGWLKVITASKVSDHFRRRYREPQAVGGSDAHEQIQNHIDPQPGDTDATAEEEGILYRQALELLRQEYAEKTWQAFWKVVIEARTPAEVAAELGMTTNAIYLARSRILGRLRREFCEALMPQSAVKSPVCVADPSS